MFKCHMWSINTILDNVEAILITPKLDWAVSTEMCEFPLPSYSVEPFLLRIHKHYQLP